MLGVSAESTQLAHCSDHRGSSLECMVGYLLGRLEAPGNTWLLFWPGGVPAARAILHKSAASAEGLWRLQAGITKTLRRLLGVLVGGVFDFGYRPCVANF